MTGIAVRLIALLSFCAALGVAATTPSADYVYPSGAGAPTNTKILIHFLCCGETNIEPVAVRSATQTVTGRSEYVDFQWIVFTPAQPLPANTTFTVVVTLPYRTPYTGTFTTGSSPDTTRPMVVSTIPVDKQDILLLSQPVQIRFSKPLNPLSLAKAFPVVADLHDGRILSSGATTSRVDSSTILINPMNGLLRPSVYRVYFPGALPEDLCGNTLAAPSPDFVFTTYPEAPKDGARLRASVPADSDTGVPTNASIFLMFDRPVTTPADGALVLSSESEPAIPLKVEAIAVRNVLIVRPQALLRGNRKYVLRADRLFDEYGGQVAGSSLLSFTTGILPELRSFTQLSGPPSPMPNATRVRWRFSRPLNRYLLPRLASISQATAYNPSTVDTRLLEDGVTLEADLSGPGEYALAGYAYDRVESKTTGGSSTSFRVSPVRDDRPPIPLATFPPDGATGVPPNVSPAIAFDETLDTVESGAVVLWRGADRVPADVITSDSVVTIRPRQPLELGSDYRVEMTAPRDLSGNRGADVSWTFHVEAISGADPFKVVQVEPASGSTNVAPDTPLAITFNRPPNPLSLMNYCSRVMVGDDTVAGRWRVEGNRAVFSPDPRFPAARRVEWTACATADFAGQTADNSGTSGAFWTALSDQPPPPFSVLSVWPAGTDVSVGGDGAVVLQFNGAAVGATVTDKSVFLYSADGRRQPVRVYYDGTKQQVRVITDVLLSGTFTVVTTSDIASPLGAALAPFSANVRIKPQTLAYGLPTQPVDPSFIRSVAFNSAAGLTSPLVVYFKQPMDRVRAEQGLRFISGGGTLSGHIEWAPDSTALTFFPSAPLVADSEGYVLLSLVPWARSGGELSNFNLQSVDQNPRVQWNLISPFAHVPTDGVFDIRFDTDRSPDSVRSAVALVGSQNNPLTIPLEISQRSARVFRLRPPHPLDPGGYYTVEFQADGIDKQRQFVSTYSFATPQSRQVSVGPTEAMGEAPLNSVIWLQSQTTLNLLTVNPHVTLNGEEVPFTAQFLDGGFLVLIRPLGLWRGNSTYKVGLTGVEDMAGRPLPDRSWSFRTGSGPDFTPTAVTSWSPTNAASTASVLRVKFDKPVFFRREQSQNREISNPYDFAVVTSAATIYGGVQPASDGRTLSFTPNRPWPFNSNINVAINSFNYSDWTAAAIYDGRGSGRDFSAVGFYVSSEAGLLPKVEAFNPPPDALEVPRNVQIQARFNTGLLGSNLAGVQLETDGSTVLSSVILASDGRTITVLPARPLDPLRHYTVTLAGVQNTEGTPLTDAAPWSFVTSEAIVGPPPDALLVPVWSDPFSFRVLLPRPVNPISITPDTFDLRTRGLRVAVGIEVESGGTAIRITPKVPSADPAAWQLTVDGLLDSAGFPFTKLQLSLSISDFANHHTQPPQLQSMMPVPGTSIAWNSSAAAVFDQPVYLRNGVNSVRLMTGKQMVPATLRQSTRNAIVVGPAQDWRLGATYTMEISGIVGLGGNEAPNVSWSFTIAQDGTPDATALRLVSSSPAQGAVGVSPDAPIVLEFSKPVIPKSTDSALVYFDRLDQKFRTTWDQNRLRIDPLPALPNGTQITFWARVNDLYGRSLESHLAFVTAGPQDTILPKVESISPTPGSHLPAGRNDFIIRFSEPFQATGNWIAFSAGGQLYRAQVSFPTESDGRSAVATIDLPGDQSGTLNIGSGVVDLSGNALEPISFEFSTGPTEESSQPRVTAMRPADGSYDVPLDAAIEVRFNQAMNEAPLAAALHVVNDGYLVPITLTHEDDGRIWHVIPSTPWQPGSGVTLTVADSAFSVAGIVLSNPFSGQFRTAKSASNMSAGNPVVALQAYPDAVDVRFAADLPGGPGEPFGLRSGNARIPGVLDRLGPAWYRFTPDTELDPGLRYHLMAGPGVEFPLRISSRQYEIRNSRTASPPSVESTPSGSLVLTFATPINAFSGTRETLAVFDQQGSTVPYQARLSDDCRTLTVEPFGSARTTRITWRGVEVFGHGSAGH